MGVAKCLNVKVAELGIDALFECALPTFKKEWQSAKHHWKKRLRADVPKFLKRETGDTNLHEAIDCTSRSFPGLGSLVVVEVNSHKLTKA